MSPPDFRSGKPDPVALAVEVKAEARRLGFDLVGITTPDPPPHVQVYQDWLAAGRHAEMNYLASARARQRRADPHLILPECRSILVVGVHYPPPPAIGDETGRGQVAAYAQGDDYHDVLLPRLEKLVAFIETRLGEPVTHRLYTDTGPLLERELAQRAGLGWIGKNTCLIHPQQGSYFLLAEALLGVSLATDEPMQVDHCGTCRRCIDACPTACILPDRTLDAGRCISYLSIELKNAIPLDLRAPMGDWLFGCDICQQVCPWNVRFATAKGDPVFQARPFLERPDAGRFLSLDDETYKQAMRASPLKRAKRRGLARNAAVALGNQGDPQDIQTLSRALTEDPEPLVRAHAAWALGRMGVESGRVALIEAQERELEPAVLQEIEAALGPHP